MLHIVYTILGTFNSGGMERVLANKANFLARKGYEITIITTDQQNRKPYFELDHNIRCIDLGINYTEEQDSNIISKSVSYLFKQREHKRKLKEWLCRLKPHITVSMFDNDASFITSIEDGSKKVGEIHFSRFKRLQYGRKGIWGLVDRWRSEQDLRLAEKFDRFVVLTEEDKGYWGNLPNIEVIPNANSFESDNKATLTHKQVVAIGRYDYQKGFDELIHIWRRVQTQYPEWKLCIYGQGPLKSFLEQLIRELQLEDSVSLMPPVRDVKQVYLNSSILAMTSRYEGLPMVLLEAQVCGVPMISYMCKCGPKDIITEGENGFLIEEGDREAFAAKLMLLMEDTSLRLRMGAKAVENAKRYEREVIMEKWISLFDKLVVHGY